MRLLLAEDEPILLAFLKSVVEGMTLPFPCEIFCAENGKAAYELLCSNPIDLAIVDIMMPEMTGLQLMEKSAENHLLKTQFIIYSGFQEFAYAQKAMQLGAFDYLVKPVDQEVLYTTLVHANNKIFGENSPETSRATRYSSLVTKLIQALDQNLSDPNLSLKWLCQNLLYVNETHAGRVFTKEVGIKFSDYMKEERLKLAINLLEEDPEALIANIACTIGYETNPDYFIEIFKKKYQMTPKQYQKQLKQRT